MNTMELPLHFRQHLEYFCLIWHNVGNRGHGALKFGETQIVYYLCNPLILRDS